jgi:hypothetical protein
LKITELNFSVCLYYIKYSLFVYTF